MAKQKKAETVSIKRNNVTKDIPKAQWDAMVKSKSTYGWKLASDLSDEVLEKDKQIENSKIGDLENEVKDLKANLQESHDENDNLKSQLAEKDTKIGDLENEVKAYEVTVENLELKIKELTPSSDDKAAPKADKASAKTGK